MRNKNYLKTMCQKTWEQVGERGKNLAPLNLSKAKRNFLLIDTETIGDITKGEKAFPYDVSFINIEKREIIYKKSYINKNIYDNEYLMSNAFYRNKIPFYDEKLCTSEDYERIDEKELLERLNSFIKENKIKYFLAFNVKFDYNSINNLYNKNEIKNEFQKLYVVDIWKICTDMLKKFPTLYEKYMVFCYKNNLLTDSKLNVKTSAEAFNRFVNNDVTFEESHTGLEDTYCELNILKKMLWYYEKETGEDYYYKLDSVFSPHGFIFKGGIFRVECLPPILKKYGLA